ncbi:MAG TPA: ester cyclase [Gemmatimonadales bacterium]|nr:ester cyclase [Gemmatimonadales bacterium]
MHRPLVLLGCLGCVTAAGSLACRQQTPSDAFRLVFEQGVAHRDTAAINEAVAPELIFHERQNVARVPRSQLLQLAGSILEGFPDIRFSVESVIAQGDSAAARITFTGTHQGNWEGIAATGRHVTVTEMFFCRLRGGKLAECWEDWDKWGLIQQLRSSSN